MTESNNKKPWEDSVFPFSQKPEFITDKSYIAKLDKMELYICPSETEETYDQEMIQNNTLKKSADAVGQDSSILVAVWPDDPNKDSDTSEERVNMRPINGRHRYKADKDWKRKYIWMTGGFPQYLYFRMVFDHKKKDNPAEKKIMLKWEGNYYLRHGCPIQKISATLCRMHPEMHKQTIINLLPKKWRDSTKAANRKGKFKQKNDKNINDDCQQKIAKLNTQLQNKEKETEDLKNENKIKEEKIKKLEKDNANLSEYIKKTFLNKEM